MSYELTWEKHGVLKRFWGNVSGEELAESVEKVAANHRFDELRFIVNDFLAVDSYVFDAQSMLRITISRMGSRYSNPNIRVLLVTTDPVLFAMSDTTQRTAFPSTNETKSFATVAEARDWFSRQPRLNHRILGGEFGHRSTQ